MANLPVPGKLQKTSSDPIQLRRCSTGFIDDRTNEANVFPNYLRRTSIGSCHDFCKYGAKHDSNMSERTPAVKGFSAARRKSTEPAKNDTLQKKSSSSNSRPPLIFSTERKAMNPKRSQESKQKYLVSKENCISPTRQVRKKDIEICSGKGASTGNERNSSGALFKTGKGKRNSNKSKDRTHFPPTSGTPSCRYGAVKVKKMVLNRKQKGKTTPKKLSYNNSMDSLHKAEILQHPSDEDVPEKIIHVIETNTQNPKDISSDEMEKQKEREADHESESPQKLKFKKVKEIEIESESHDAGNRLKFRHEKLLDNENEHEIAETMVKKCSKTPDTASGQPDETTNEVDEVVLRPQHTKQAENTQSLYDNVNEKTAENLVMTKNSKVKALVNAFETIISLQDDKSQGK